MLTTWGLFKILVEGDSINTWGKHGRFKTMFLKSRLKYLKNTCEGQGMTNGVRAFVMNKNPMLFLAHEQQTFYASTCMNAEFSYFMFVM